MRSTPLRRAQGVWGHPGDRARSQPANIRPRHEFREVFLNCFVHQFRDRNNGEGHSAQHHEDANRRQHRQPVQSGDHSRIACHQSRYQDHPFAAHSGRHLPALYFKYPIHEVLNLHRFCVRSHPVHSHPVSLLDPVFQSERQSAISDCDYPTRCAA